MNSLAETTHPAPATARVAVVIAFFQRKPGLLLKAVRSVLAQVGADMRVIVVDDESPVHARAELSCLTPAELAKIVVIEQPNAGPGAARNRGIAAVPADCEFVAFLDSDDAWTQDHIARALTAFTLGADFYFTNYVPLGSTLSKFEFCDLHPDDPPHISKGDDLYIYGGDLFDAHLRKSPVGTSTVVYRKNIGAGHGFPTEFRCGEDIFFWMLLTRNARKVMFSSRAEAIYGAGVNIWASANWGSPSALQRLYDEYIYHRAVATRFPLTPEQIDWSEGYRRSIAKTFVANFIHLLVHFKSVNWRCVARFFAADPAALIYLIRR